MLTRRRMGEAGAHGCTRKVEKGGQALCSGVHMNREAPLSAAARPPQAPPLLCHAFPRFRPEGGSEGEEDEEDVRMLRPATAAPVEVDEDFEREFSQLMLDYQGRGARQAPGGPGAAAVAAPPAGPGPAPAAPASHGGSSGEAGSGGGGPGEAVAFKVMMKRGGREDRSRELRIPLSAGMAAHLRQKEEREAAEKAELKRLVLEANKRDQQVGGFWGHVARARQGAWQGT